MFWLICNNELFQRQQWDRVWMPCTKKTLNM